MTKSVVSKGNFILGFGREGTFGSIELRVSYASTIKIEWDVSIKIDGEFKVKISECILGWLSDYDQKGIVLEVAVLKVKIDPVRKNDFERAVSLAFYDALPKLGIQTPQVYASPPQLNLVVIRSKDIDRAARFYLEMGLLMGKHRHGSGPEHYTSSVNGSVFEIYPLENELQSTVGVRIGFRIDAVDVYLPRLKKLGAEIINKPHDSEWGRRAVIKDPDGHIVELIHEKSG